MKQIFGLRTMMRCLIRSALLLAIAMLACVDGAVADGSCTSPPLKMWERSVEASFDRVFLLEKVFLGVGQFVDRSMEA